jgi:UDP-perosamine 4-acetyltransferase
MTSKKKNKIIIVGAGGHARVVASILEYHSNFQTIGIAGRDESELGKTVSKYKVILTWDELCNIKKQGIDYVALAIGDNTERAGMFEYVRESGLTVPTLVHPNAFIEKKVILNEGILVCAGAILACEVVIGVNSIINTGAIIDHETNLGNHVHVGPGTVICGRVKAGDNCFIGAGSRVIDKIKIGYNVVVGAGSVVTKNIPDNVTAAGVPCRIISSR